ncbi:MAG TPA: RDD family protein [Microbacterium sp.]|nr:RDD family protein [Microbacterium sp.]
MHTMIGRRSLAYVIDLGLIAIVSGLVWWIVTTLVDGPAGLLAGAGSVALLLLVYCVLQSRGGTPGMLVAKVRLASEATGDRLAFWRVVVRNIVWAAGCAIIIGGFSVFFDSLGRGRGWHDKAVGAVVVSRTAFAGPRTGSVPTTTGPSKATISAGVELPRTKSGGVPLVDTASLRIASQTTGATREPRSITRTSLSAMEAQQASRRKLMNALVVVGAAVVLAIVAVLLAVFFL